MVTIPPKKLKIEQLHLDCDCDFIYYEDMLPSWRFLHQTFRLRHGLRSIFFQKPAFHASMFPTAASKFSKPAHRVSKPPMIASKFQRRHFALEYSLRWFQFFQRLNKVSDGKVGILPYSFWLTENIHFNIFHECQLLPAQAPQTTSLKNTESQLSLTKGI